MMDSALLKLTNTLMKSSSILLSTVAYSNNENFVSLSIALIEYRHKLTAAQTEKPFPLLKFKLQKKIVI